MLSFQILLRISLWEWQVTQCDLFSKLKITRKSKTKNNKQKPKSLAAGPTNLLAAMSTVWRRDYNIGCCTLGFCWYLASVELQWWLHGASFYAPKPRNDETQQRHSWVLLDISNNHPYHFSPQWNAHQLSQPLCHLDIPWSSQRLCLPLSILFEAFPFGSGNKLEPVKELLATVEGIRKNWAISMGSTGAEGHKHRKHWHGNGRFEHWASLLVAHTSANHVALTSEPFAKLQACASTHDHRSLFQGRYECTQQTAHHVDANSDRD